jgi:hypothetical protein
MRSAADFLTGSLRRIAPQARRAVVRRARRRGRWTAAMSSLAARPLGSNEPPTEVFLPTPVFQYGLKKGLLPPWPDLRIEIVAEGGEVALDASVDDGRSAGGFLLFELADVRAGVRYDASLVHRGERTPLFRGAELYRLAIDDPGYRALPAGAAGDGR